jgi:hypothetical protein
MKKLWVGLALCTALVAGLLVVQAQPVRGPTRETVAGGGGAGTVTGPGSSTDEAVALWDGTDGTTLKNSLCTVSVAGLITCPSATISTGDLTVTTGDLNMLGGDLDVGGGNLLLSGGDIQTVKQLFFDEQATCFGGGAATGALCVKNTVPSTIIFVDDAGTEFDLAAGVPHPPASTLQLNDDVPIQWGTAAPDASCEYDTAQTPDALWCGVSADSRLWIIAEQSDLGTDLGRALQANPTLHIHSSDALTAGDYVELSHDQTNGVIAVGAGNLNLSPAGFVDVLTDLDVQGTTDLFGALRLNGNSINSVGGINMNAAGNSLKLLDDGRVRFGDVASPDINCLYDTAQTPDAMVCSTSSDSNLWMLVENADIATDLGRAAQTNPTFHVHSADATVAGDYCEISHDQTDGVIAVGAGDLNLSIASEKVKGPKFIQITESAAAPSSVAGTGILWVDDTIPTELHFTDDAGGDKILAGLADLLMKFNPNDATYPATTPAAAITRNGRPLIAFDDAADECVNFYDWLTDDYSSTNNFRVEVDAACGGAITSGVVRWCLEVESLAVQDLDADGYAAAVCANSTCPATNGNLMTAIITLTSGQWDGGSRNTPYRLRLCRDADNAADTATEDAQFRHMAVRQ